MRGASLKVSVVIPGRDTAGTLRACLSAVVALLQSGEVHEIIYVDDGSRDESCTIAGEFPQVRCLRGTGRGAGAARNLGWQAASGELIWFLDSDCVVAPDALGRLKRHLDDPRVAAVGGSLTNATPQALLACLVHEEIVERHLRMPARVNFLATANVLYRRDVLVEMNGFDERFLKGQDAELAWRVKAAGYELAFDASATAAHHYHLRWRTYLRTQRQQGYWRAFLHTTHRGHSGGDSYSSVLDHLQPPVAILTLGSAGLAALAAVASYRGWLGDSGGTIAGWLAAATAGLATVLLLMQMPMTARLIRGTGSWRYLAYAPFGWLRSFYRGVGLTQGVIAWSKDRVFRQEPGTPGSR